MSAGEVGRGYGVFAIGLLLIGAAGCGSGGGQSSGKGGDTGSGGDGGTGSVGSVGGSTVVGMPGGKR